MIQFLVQCTTATKGLERVVDHTAGFELLELGAGLTRAAMTLCTNDRKTSELLQAGAVYTVKVERVK